MTRDFLRDSVSIAIAQDGRHSILHMRFSASQRNLTVLKGYVGSMQVKHGETITNLKKGMLRVLDRLCTPGLGGPHEGPPDLVLRELLQKRVTICVADAAYNEQGALRACAEVFPHMVSIQKDRSHAVQRLLKRPWDCDEQIYTLLQQYILGSQSICQKIQHSPALVSVFNSYLQASDKCPVRSLRKKNLAAAKHRFSSCSQPLGRFILHIDAILATLLWIATARAGREEACEATDTLAALSERELVLIAMLADIGDEAISLLRVVDTEDADLTDFPKAIEAYVRHLNCLINEGAILQQGFTAYVLEILEQPFGFLVRGKPRTIGGPGKIDENLLCGCVERLQAFLALTLETVKAEFPAHDLLNAFTVFNLGGPIDPEIERKGLLRLSLACSVDAERLRSQLADLKPLALHEKSTGAKSNFEAWRAAVARVKEHTEKAFLANRRAMTREAAQPVTLEQAQANAMAGCQALWTEDMAAEQEWQKSQGYKAKIQGYLEGILLESEIDQELIDVALCFKEMRGQKDQTRAADELRRQDLLKAKPFALQSRPFFVADGAWANLPNVNGLEAVADPCLASSWVVHDPANPGDLLTWCALLFGGHVCDVACLQANGRRGVAFHFAPAIQSVRWVFISDGFAHDHPSLASAARRARAHERSKWKVLTSWDDFALKDHSFTGDHLKESSKQKYKALALASVGEARALQMVNVFHKDGFVDFLAKVATASKGFCGV
ncbi:unnamed protein product [Durusdinium trenchii]|uniref:Cilia- and flagella-associated protein 206 n=1 Tax=Durusdinium trenchii TaxID=1381693 RepID=A0ABP0JRV4_9DINO